MAGIPFFLEPLPFTVIGSTAGPSERPPSHLAEFRYAGMVWESNATSVHSVTVDFGQAVTVDHVSLLSCNAQAGSRMSLAFGTSQAQAQSGSPGASFPYEAIITPSQTGRTAWNAFRSIAPQTFRFMVVRIDGHSGAFTASMLAAGQRITPSKYYETDWEAGPEDLGTLSFARNAVPEIADGATLRRIGFTLGRLTEAEHDLIIQPLLARLGRRNPVLCCFDPDSTVYRQGRTYFGTIADSSRARKTAFNRFEKRFEIVSII